MNDCDDGRPVYSAAQVRKRKKEALERIDALEGRGPSGMLNPSYADGYAAAAIKRDFDCDDIQKIKRWAMS